jgi:galactokinase
MSIHDFDATDRLTALAIRFGREHGRPAGGWFVPGRIEILGKHTDYGGGRTLVCALERGLSVVGAPRSDRLLRIVDVRRQSSIELDAASLAPGISWANYPLTVLRRLERNFPGAVRGADLMFDSSLPSASGMSSSSALMIAVLLGIVRASNLEAHPDWRANIASAEDVAAYAATIENGSGFRGLPGERGVGTRGGSEDHTAILCSRAGHIAQYAYRPTRYERAIALDPAWTLAVAVSGVRAQKTGNARDAYNRAAERVAEIVERWRAATGRPDETLDDALASGPGAAGRIRGLLPPALVDRFDQFVEESTVLVPAAGDQLAARDYASFGATVARSQALAETLLGNQVPETAALARLARLHGAAAASAFGAGFGGSVWALIERAESHAFLERWQNAYAAAHPDAAARAAFFTTRPGPGVVHVDGRDPRASN